MPAQRTPTDLALRALGFRDRTAAELEARLAAAGVERAERQEVIDSLGRAGYVDDRRVACARAAVLAERAAGDAFIRYDLEQRGVAADVVEAAIAALEPERARAARVVASRGPGPKTARYLASKGFAEETLAALDGLVAHDARGAIG